MLEKLAADAGRQSFGYWFGIGLDDGASRAYCRKKRKSDWHRKNTKVFAISGRTISANINLLAGGRAKIICADGSKGYVNEAPYNRILVSAAAEEIPKELKKQLAVGGRLVIPVKDSIWMIEKKSDKVFHEEEYPGFVFVPLVQ